MARDVLRVREALLPTPIRARTRAAMPLPRPAAWSWLLASEIAIAGGGNGGSPSYEQNLGEKSCNCAEENGVRYWP